MMAPAVGNGTLARMSRLETDGEPVLSLYLDLDPSRFPTPDTRDAQLRALLAQARREEGAADAERVEALVHEQLEAGLGTGGHAAAGLDEVLATLGEDRVATLLLAPGAEPAHAVEQAIELAARQDADVAFLRYETAPLTRRGGIAALLRW